MANVIPVAAIHVSKPHVERVADYSALDRVRLRTYIHERVKESKRLASVTRHESIAHAHKHSVKVGQQILDEIDKHWGNTLEFK